MQPGSLLAPAPLVLEWPPSNGGEPERGGGVVFVLYTSSAAEQSCLLEEAGVRTPPIGRGEMVKPFKLSRREMRLNWHPHPLLWVASPVRWTLQQAGTLALAMALALKSLLSHGECLHIGGAGVWDGESNRAERSRAVPCSPSHFATTPISARFGSVQR